MSEDGLKASVEKMEAEGIPQAAIDTFRHYYEQLESGETGMLPESDIEPVEEVAEFGELPEEDGPLDQAVVIKLNGGLGTSMGMTQAKSLIEAKDGLSFLDVVARQVAALRERAGAPVPLVLMNSFATRDDSLEALEKHPELESSVPADFVQHKEPKLLVDGLTPAEWPDNPALEWCPPGHGDLYTALLTSGMLDALLDGGFRYAFISNSDNLAAVLEPRVLAWIAREEIPFVMEVTDRTEADRKGGHIARKDGGYVLRETAQTPDEDLDALQDISRHRYVNTNNLWVDLRALKTLLEEREGVLGLPLIVNKKTVDPGDKSSPRCSSSRRRWAPRWACSTARGRCASRAPGSPRSSRPRTCSRCARTPTCCATMPASTSTTGATARRRWSTSTTTTSRGWPTSSRASRRARRRSSRRSGSPSRATSRSAATSSYAAPSPSPGPPGSTTTPSSRASRPCAGPLTGGARRRDQVPPP